MPRAVEDEVEYAPGQLIAGKYRVARRLGRGSLGTVYEVTREELEKKCALKVMKRSLIGDDEAVARFRAEARTNAMLEGSAHVCTVFDYGVLGDGAPFYAMTLLQGRPLRDVIHHLYVAKQERFPPKQAMAVARQAFEGLAFAHERGFVHGDLGPAKLFVQLVQQAWWVVLVDFRFAPGSDGDVSAKADIHAMGEVLFKMLTGRAPPAAPLATVLDGIPGEVAALFERCLSPDPVDRPDARALAEQFRTLEQASWGAPAGMAATYEEGGPGVVSRAPRAAVVETPIAVSRWQQDQAQWDRSQDRLRRRRRRERWMVRGVLGVFAAGVAGGFWTVLRKQPVEVVVPSAAASSALVQPAGPAVMADALPAKSASVGERTQSAPLAPPPSAPLAPPQGAPPSGAPAISSTPAASGAASVESSPAAASSSSSHPAHPHAKPAASGQEFELERGID